MGANHLQTNIAQYAIIIENKKMLVLWPRRDSVLWCLPGGRLDEDETNPEAALQREIQEELGITVTINEPFSVDMWDVKGKEHRYAVFFKCDLNPKDEPNITLSQDHAKHEWLTYDELMDVLQKEPERGRAGIVLLEKLREKGML